MKRVFNYCVYRLANGYEKSGDSNPIIMAYGLLLTALGGYAVALINLVFYYLHIPMDTTKIICIMVPFYVIDGILCFSGNIDKRYQTWKKQYKGEVHKKRNGYFIGLFLAFSLISLIVSIAVFR